MRCIIITAINSDFTVEREREREKERERARAREREAKVGIPGVLQIGYYKIH